MIRRWWARLCHRLAVRSARPCPECGRPVLPLDAWAYFAGEVYHWPCLREKFGLDQYRTSADADVYVYGEIPR